ncbi:MAG: hypothetical protein KGJ23_09100 [Euryarchaeota archaeon]|nr:hypothetical protein [Euryarchaeota archaeon]MDE1836761.1 hypothetical protein [Euryarchaeota archaeon]MDE1879779.1 hypothetical protein [Euryarchaeota archaeon]MDE2044745.1 hypothetical protein [Thermoplasmata archaeon]
MAAPTGGTSWSVPVLHGPSSVDNLLTTLVAWARHRGRNPRSFYLSLENDGRTLMLRGFDLPLLKDFLRYAEYSSVPALECGRPTEIAAPSPASASLQEVVAPGPPPAPTPSAAPTPTRPPTLSSSSIQMVLGTAQLLADRSTDVHSAEHWVTSILATPDLKPEEVGLLLRLMHEPEPEALRLALAENSTLRSQGEALMKVPCEQIPDTLQAWLGTPNPPPSATPATNAPPSSAPPSPPAAAADPGSKKKVRRTAPVESASVPTPPPQTPAPPPRPTDNEVLLRVQIFARGLEARAQHWREVASRLRASLAQGFPGLVSVLEGAVFINEEEPRVSWVVPHNNSAVVKTITGYVHESHQLLREEATRRATESGSWVGEARRETYAALETARRSTQLALRLGVELRWVVLLSTDFNDGKEEGLGLPLGTRPPWEGTPPPPTVPTLGSPSKTTLKKKVVPLGPPALARFSSDMDAPLEAWLEKGGIKVGLLSPSATAANVAPPPSTAVPKVPTTATVVRPAAPTA